jgi:hypothetical protein
MTTMYPEHMRTVLAYIDALNAVEKMIASTEGYDGHILLDITVNYEDEFFGRIVDEIGGVWSFTDTRREA